MEYTINANAAFNSIEIAFDCKPSEEIREALKTLKFRWHGVKKVWYGYCTEEQARAAIEGEKPVCKESRKAEPVNKYGVKVGDIFHASWGFEQTNNNFFQVIALVGETSVRIREVYLDLESETAVSSMSADRKFRLPSEILPAASHASFVEDQKNGDLKRVSNKYGVSIKVGRSGGYQTNAYPYHGETVYESWYY